jgi:hypothetical protein
VAKESFRSMSIPALLHQNIEHLPIIVDGSPQVHAPAIHPQKDLIG